MGRSPLTLAALATSAIDGLVVTGTRTHTWNGDGDFDSAVLLTDDSHQLLFRIPNSVSAEARATAELAALSALSAGIRSRLPFAVPAFVGHTTVGPTIARLYEFIYGEPVNLRELRSNGELCTSLGRAIAAIHDLPTAVVEDFGLPQKSATAVAAGVAGIVDRAQSTGRLPANVHVRWEETLANESMWTFSPTVTHGDLSEASFAVSGHAVTGIFGWSEFCTGDPATDLAWFIDLPGVGSDIAEAYVAARAGRADEAVRGRALLHRELDLARWLLHGVDIGDSAIVDDGARMLRSLSADIERGAVAPLVPKSASLSETDGQQNSSADADLGTGKAAGAPIPADGVTAAQAAGRDDNGSPSAEGPGKGVTARAVAAASAADLDDDAVIVEPSTVAAVVLDTGESSPVQESDREKEPAPEKPEASEEPEEAEAPEADDPPDAATTTVEETATVEAGDASPVPPSNAGAPKPAPTPESTISVIFPDSPGRAISFSSDERKPAPRSENR